MVFILLTLILLTILDSMLGYRTMSNIRNFNRFQSLLFSTTEKNWNFAGLIPQKYIALNHRNFFQNRNWTLVESYWSSIIQKSISNNDQYFHQLPSFITGYNQFSNYGITNLKEIEKIGYQGEFLSRDTLYTSRYNYAIRIGYVGSCYKGYQTQNKVAQGFVTVEDDIREIIGITPNAAGRTDRGVSAISQIICFKSKHQESPESFLVKFNQSKPCQQGELVAYECVRVPRKFNARSRATWRRYLYLFPINANDHIDIDFLNNVLKRIEGVELNYNAFCRGEQKNIGQGMQDLCIIYRTICSEVTLEMNESNSIIRLVQEKALCFEFVGNRFLRNMVRIIVATAIRESLLSENQRNVNVLIDACNSGLRYMTESPILGEGLCLAGVGYDLNDLAIYKNMPKSKSTELKTRLLSLPP